MTLLGQQRAAAEAIQRVQLYGQRCSGTNYLQRLIERNLPDLPVTFSFGYKHFPPKHLEQPHGDCLFCVIVRDPFDWVRSFHRTPWHAAPRLRSLPFGRFIRAAWHAVWDSQSDTPADDPRFGTEMMHERHPESGQRYANVLQMRSDRLRRWRALADRVEHHWWVQYESLCRYPELLIDDLAQAAGRRRQSPFQPVDRYKGFPASPPYRPRRYPAVPPDHYRFLLAELDWSVENRLGYYPRPESVCCPRAATIGSNRRPPTILVP